VNICLFVGRLTADPELRYTNTGKAVVDFSVAINEGKDRVTYANCQIWEEQAERLAEFYKKGKPIAVQSRLSNNKWTDKEGNTRNSDRFVVTFWNFVPSDGGKQESLSSEEEKTPVKNSKKSGKKSTPKPPPPPPPTNDVDGFTTTSDNNSDEEDDEDIPF
jgi:single-strand DNA-binding protein